MVDGSLVVKDRLNGTVWLAPTNCPAGALLEAWGQCGGTTTPAGSPYAPKEGQYPGTCCPAGWTCVKVSAAKWTCQPSAALDPHVGER